MPHLGFFAPPSAEFCFSESGPGPQPSQATLWGVVGLWLCWESGMENACFFVFIYVLNREYCLSVLNGLPCTPQKDTLKFELLVPPSMSLFGNRVLEEITLK